MKTMKEIEQLIQRYMDAIHSQNETDFKSLWTGEDTDRLISGTKFFEGTDNIYQDFLIDLVRKRYSSIYLINDGLQSRLLTDTVAVAVFRYRTDCVIRENGQPYSMAGIETQVLKKTKDGWKIAHIHYHGKAITS